MRTTFRCAAPQLTRAEKKLTPLRRMMMEAIVLSPTSTAAGTAARDSGIAAKGCSTECTSVFATPPCEIFEGNNKQAWIDLRQGYCHLCQEPIGTNAGTHIGERDHTNMQFFLLLYTAYPRRDCMAEALAAGTAGERAGLLSSDMLRGEPPQGHADPSGAAPAAASSSSSASAPRATTASAEPFDTSAVASLFTESGRCCGSRASPPTFVSRLAKHDAALWRADDVLHGIAALSPSLRRFATDHRTTDQLHTMDDATRRTELEALLFYLTHPPHQALPHVLQGTSAYGFSHSGERMLKYEMTRLISQVFPPLSAGMMTNFTQKCWGRTNEERLYDALRLQRIKTYYGWGPYASKEKKGFFIRQLIYELMLSEVRPELSETGKLLAAQAVRRMAFELVFLLSMDYMHRVQRVHELMGRPTLEELRALNLL
ncbi:putative mitochondrial KREPB8 (KREPB8) [Leptomonas pyrrhocoris]|uniref:Putative mitochondrial KREPB8 (KREPB8) n=1 Tax=Leptomonas pyrrhocoris TaxID=157538 RepID=A0A0M9FX86_LEPPY|nr:putative mitochondrial KREPB8 (KREPB8) [Leptomonas pyrrhocoris]XP_015656248.1 putative mitochondrial KREPB8 (KREPB8) [Leptomonas pyrrhocoris]KPA77808.1 putative mitochondrial KREPB8 (KREPB8) [Leptomonas pyrrhocoris]KPA77809.1 putative mitochondrial KREPB8 (KREPB8) [Leptomonas pyrrhocoris]|eukprot:XP_015656247.1 putative mitochondrial KREPB8 (KREPB8) [Leptomonas pyrrhocoris]